MIQKWAKIALQAILAAKFCLGSPLIANAVITNPYREDGFGSQFQTIIYSIIHAELYQKTFVYTPFRHVEHNYDNNSAFIQKLEWLVNLTDYYPINTNIALQHQINPVQYIQSFEHHLHACANSVSLKKIKEIFRANKDKKNYFPDNCLNIAVHIRRPNPHDNRVLGTNSPDSIYLQAIDRLRREYAAKPHLFHIYSQGNLENFKSTFVGEDIVFHIDEPLDVTFPSLVFADVLVTSTSSMSYTAALLSEGTVYYVPFWHPPLPGWKII